MKKILALVIAAIMILSIGVTAMASGDATDPAEATTKTITLTGGKAGHTYTAYQIFKGTANETTGELTDIVWGDGVTDGYKSSFATAAAAAKSIATKNDARATAKELVTNNYLVAAKGHPVTLTTDGNVSIDNLEEGYYIVVDTVADGTVADENDVYSEYVVQLVGNVNMALKSSIPTVEKKVQDNDYQLNDGWNDVGDFSIGDTVPYKLTGTVADNYAEYTKYKYIFHDTLSKGQAFQNDIKVTIDGNAEKDITSNFTITPSATTDGKNATDITISCVDLKQISGLTATSKIVVTYTAKLTADAVIGLDGNNNTVYLEFSNNPEDNGEGTSKTKPDETVVFTYELDTLKVDGKTNEALKDAKFVFKKGAKFAVITDGKLSGWVDSQDDATELETPANGKFVIAGLDAGTYALVETKAPTGYNKIEGEIAVVVTATQANVDDYKESETHNAPSTVLTYIASEVTIPQHQKVVSEGDVATGIVDATIANNSGSTLPETGGMGTTIFYIIGAILVIGAGILLVSKKRMSAN